MLASAPFMRGVVATLVLVVLILPIEAQENTLDLGPQEAQLLDQQALDKQELGQEISSDPMTGGETGVTLPNKPGNNVHTALKSSTNLAAASAPTQTGTEAAAVAPNEVSNWLFVVPVALALVSLGLAVRARVPTRRRGFNKLQDGAHPLEDINPFCGDNCAFEVEDDDLETPGHFQGENSSEEGRCVEEVEMENEESELLESEKMAMQQALVVRIDQTSSSDEEVEI